MNVCQDSGKNIPQLPISVQLSLSSRVEKSLGAATFDETPLELINVGVIIFIDDFW